MAILTTKLYPPPVTPDLEVRTSLLRQLDNNRHRSLTLISAPPGYGKSILASMWLEASDCNYAWISLDKSDSDLRTFLTYLLAAVRMSFPNAMSSTQTLLDAPVLKPPIVVRYLLNDLQRIGEPLIVALDDLHLVEQQEVYDLLEDIARYPAPFFHLVLITRKDPPLPIALLRARRQVNEIRTRELRFSASETASLLSKWLHRKIDEETATTWAERTEGWVTAIHLAALSLSLRDRDVNLNIIDGGGNSYLQEYLVSEVVTQCSKIQRDWLLRVSLLDRFCAPLCDAMSRSGNFGSNDDLTGEEFVRWLQEHNFFVIPLDDQRHWFRFHHLFRAQLQRLLERNQDPDTIYALHRRASLWFSDNGLYEESIRHSYAAEDTEAVQEVILQCRHKLMNQGQWRQLDRWLQMLPFDFIADHPLLALTKARLPSSHGQMQYTLTARAGSLAASLPPDEPATKEVVGELAALAALQAVFGGLGDVVIDKADRALSLLPPEAQYIRCELIGIRAIGYQMLGDYKQAIRQFELADRTQIWSNKLRCRLLVYASFVSLTEGDLSTAFVSILECVRQDAKNRSWITFGRAGYIAGTIHYLRNELEEAELHLRALVENRQLIEPEYLAHGVCLLLRINIARGQLEEAEDLLQLAANHLQEIGNVWSLGVLRGFEVELALARGDVDAAQVLAQNVDFHTNRVIWFHYLIKLTPAKLLLVQGSGANLVRARTLLDELEAQAREIHRKAALIDILALQALVVDAEGDRATAFKRLTEALTLGKLGGFIRSFVDLGAPMADLLTQLRRVGDNMESAVVQYLDRILAAFSANEQSGRRTNLQTVVARTVTASMIDLIEPLTKREIQILQLLATDLTPHEIGQQINISTATVRTHTKNIYAKLNAHNRLEAIHHAQDFGLI